MSEFKITGPGRYVTRAGTDAIVTHKNGHDTYPWNGTRDGVPDCWMEDGRHMRASENDYDIVTRVDTPVEDRAAEPANSKRAEILDAAKQAVADRGLNYGKPEDNFLRIALLWNAHLVNSGLLDHTVLQNGTGIEASDVAIMLALVKIARLENDPAHQDSWVDIAGYAACGGEISVA